MAEDKKESVDYSKRAFMKKALIGGIAAVSTAAVAKKLISSEAAGKKNTQKAYVNDELMQDKIMKDKQFVLMTREEKDQMVQMFVSDYNKQA